MGLTSREAATKLLAAAHGGDATAADRLLPLVYEELRVLARAWLAREASGHTLPPTALVHEAYLRLIGDEQANWTNRAHFFSAAATSMRRILVEHARARNAQKRGGDRKRVHTSQSAAVLLPRDLDILALNEALAKLEAQDPRACEIIMLRHFGGLSIDQTAAALNLSPRTVVREWRCARAWLAGEVSKGDTSVNCGEDNERT